jgi:peptide methionine sulfoxide reductase MsrA
VWRTRAGYAGGDKQNPTYHDLGDQTECFQVDFDPATVSYEELLGLALASHDPTRAAYKVQYASLVLAGDEAQLATAQAVASRMERQLGRKLATRIEPLKRFWIAEDYHQKYHLRGNRTLLHDFRAMFGGDEAALRESTSAARVNGYAAGEGTTAQLGREIDLLGLSPDGRSTLIARIGGAGDGIGCSLG